MAGAPASRRRLHEGEMEPTNIAAPDYFHKVVDCQWACPAHTPVPEYIRLIGAGRYADAYMVNWESNVFPGILGRTCDRPCQSSWRRPRVAHRGARPRAAVLVVLKLPSNPLLAFVECVVAPLAFLTRGDHRRR